MLLADSYPSMEETHDLFLPMYRCCSYNIAIYNNIIEATKSVGETGYLNKTRC